MVFPTGAALSLDARRRGRRAIPRGVLWVLRTQVALVYVHAALAKVSALREENRQLRAEPVWEIF